MITLGYPIVDSPKFIDRVDLVKYKNIKLIEVCNGGGHGS